mgnify:CR=1 FL=1
MDYASESLKRHYDWKGKIEVVCRCPLEDKDDLSLAYTPGVAQPCLEIQKDVNKSYELTRRSNLVAVVTDGTADLVTSDRKQECRLWKENVHSLKPLEMWMQYRFVCVPKKWMIS